MSLPFPPPRSFLPHTTVAQTAEHLAGVVDSDANGTTEFVVCRRMTTDTDTAVPIAIGKVGLWARGGAEIGFVLRRDEWRKGFMSEALQTLLPYYFNHLGYTRITADVDPRNTASLGLLAKFGFVVTGEQERTVLLGTEWADSVYLELTKDTWLQLAL